MDRGTGERGALDPRIGGRFVAPSCSVAGTAWSLDGAGLVVAAMGGLPWFTEAPNSLLPRAACTCCTWAATGAMCRSRE